MSCTLTDIAIKDITFFCVKNIIASNGKFCLYYYIDKKLDMAAVTKIFGSSAHHYMLIGTGLNVKVSDLMPIPGTASTNLIIVFQRWFDANRNVNWDTLISLCDQYPDQLGKAKSKLLAYIGKCKIKKHINSTYLLYFYKLT